CTIFDYW
nr:immunoglobulin heavy chain junction region [Macaca mulatta]